MLKKVKVRSLLLGGFITLLFIALISKLYWLQVIQADELMEKARINWETSNILKPDRGTIYDRNDQILAADLTGFTVVINPDKINKSGRANEITALLADKLEYTPQGRVTLHGYVTKMVNGKYVQHQEIGMKGKKIDKEVKEEIETELAMRGITEGVAFIEETKRYYPKQELAAHVIGYYDKYDNPGLGIEEQFDDILKGVPGSISYRKDRSGIELPDRRLEYTPPEHGQSVRLTIDENIQSILQEAMEQSFYAYSPQSMTAIAVNPHTLEVLGMANYPTFDPTEYWNIDNYNNHAIMSQYEPGSTFKIVTLAAAVEEGIFNPNETFMSGSILVGNRRLHDHNYVGWGEISYLEGVKRSTNVGFVKLGYEQLGAEKFRQYITNFGFGDRTNIGLKGEITGAISFRDNIATEIATATYGQGRVTVTPIQQIAAISAIANGGKLMKPYIVKDIIDSETNEVIESFDPEEVRTVISEETAQEVGSYLEGVVSDQEVGTGRMAYIEGYRIAGKTGTANKVVGGEYKEGAYVISFIGYAPVDDPQIAVLVIADEPDIQGDYRRGGAVVGPVFKEIMQRSLQYLEFEQQEDIQQEVSDTETSQTILVPDVQELDAYAAKNEIEIAGLNVEFIGNGNKVLSQSPQPQTQLIAKQTVYLITQSDFVPDFTGKSLRDALELSTILGIEVKIDGEGYVYNQSITSDVNQDTQLLLQLKPHDMPIPEDVDQVDEENGEESTDIEQDENE
ncbi:penicillin-binding protein [Longirhabdus pacifica]|uniref:penicillin-binding protein n=1 Tax=Longirhabdus pacifica TaxID=2305227 RepID=UPI001009394F|nr:PASTA domain-containing penicillin-binding protein [Longirhabdus pacifica]